MEASSFSKVESGLHPTSEKLSSYRPDRETSHLDPLSLRIEIEGEMPFSDEEEAGPSSFTYQTVPVVVGQIAEGRCKIMGVDQMMPELKKLAVRGELSEREKHVFRYFRRRRITELLQFMMNHLLTSQPDDSIDFLRGLLDQCLLFRSGLLREPPILYGPEHLESLFSAFDPLNTNGITLQQYHNAMRTLMVRNYNKQPEINDEKIITRTVFMSNAKMSLVGNLLDLLAPVQPDDGGLTKKPNETITRNKAANDRKEIKSYMKNLARSMHNPYEQDESQEVALANAKSNPIVPESSQAKLEKFGEYARPLKYLQEAFKSTSEQYP